MNIPIIPEKIHVVEQEKKKSFFLHSRRLMKFKSWTEAWELGRRSQAPVHWVLKPSIFWIFKWSQRSSSGTSRFSEKNTATPYYLKGCSWHKNFPQCFGNQADCKILVLQPQCGNLRIYCHFFVQSIEKDCELQKLQFLQS